LDPAGFAAVGTHYRTGRGNTVTSVKWVGNAAGISATSYDLNVLFSGFSGDSSFYSVECGTGTTWTHNASIASVTDPGVASTTVGISTEELYVPTSGTFSSTPAASANVLTIIGSSTTGNVVQFSTTAAGGTLIMTSAGRVGIGTTTPGTLLHVNGTITAPTANIQGYNAQWTWSGGGTISLSSNVTSGYNLLWSARFIGIPLSRQSGYNTVGYVDVSCPTSGTIAYYAGTVTTVSCSASGINIPADWTGLYYRVTPGQAAASDPAKFALVQYQSSLWTPTSDWILLGTLNYDYSYFKCIPAQVNIPAGYSYNVVNDTKSRVNAGSVAIGGTATLNTISVFTDWQNYTGSFVSGGGNLSISHYSYMRLGNTVYYSLRIGAGSGGGSSTTDVQLSLPIAANVFESSFACASGSGYFRASGTAASRTTLTALIPTSGAYIFFVRSGGGTVVGTDMTTTNGEIAAQGFYRI
jgi:hypothetical protein